MTDRSFLVHLERLEYLTSYEVYNWLVEILSFINYIKCRHMFKILWILPWIYINIINSGDGGASAANVKRISCVAHPS